MFSKCLLLLLLAEATLGIRVFLHPAPSSRSSSSLTPAQARAVVSHHLGLEAFDPIQDVKGVEQFVSGEFVGKGTENALLVTLSEDVARDVIPSTVKQSFLLPNPPSVEAEVSSVVSSYLQRSQHVYTTIFSEAPLDIAPRLLIDVFTAHPSEATELFFSETSQLVAFVESEETDSFGAFSLKGISQLLDVYGRDSELYQLAAETTRAIIESALSKPSFALAILTYPTVPTQVHAARQQPPQSPLPPYATPSPQLPIGGVSTCHASADACGNATSSCSGHGACVEAHKAGRTCFVCACAPTRDDAGRVQEWAGDACERKDVSSSFVLITGTVIGIILVIFGSVSLLYTVGNQELPSTLVAGASGHVKRD
ncbi:uncharacterized protein FOMMEDRAFT_146521 [Fomitiporia mediterranea MF3/22]|uniref:uncharacterized protein n=1 Tax=Fomitiporia mediterranea (strain MF3/22) TaxID=694068 RepID=UPI0004408A64|nr:uncharacterized protein FOMMEDRAFT_146521 [Fomitiporia mediterranea MF3/22]EJD02613.1 hypothetical protein FOMMEDRAFT_146521 [Fomitiporia mediterranea MF3/22]